MTWPSWQRTQQAIRMAAGMAVLHHEVWQAPHVRVEILGTALFLLFAPEIVKVDQWLWFLRNQPGDGPRSGSPDTRSSPGSERSSSPSTSQRS